MAEINIPQEWMQSSLGEIAKYINGRAFKSSEWEQEGLPIIRIQNLNNPNAPYNFSSQIFEDKYKVQYGDILYSWSASLDCYLWKGGDAYLNQHIFNVKPFFKINTKFIYFLLKYISIEIMSLTHGSGIVHITKRKFENIKVFLPSLCEQQIIADQLDFYINEAENKKKRFIQLLENIEITRQSILSRAVSGELTEDWREKNQVAALINTTIGDVAILNPKKPKVPDDLKVSFSPMTMMSTQFGKALEFEEKNWVDVKKGFTVFQNQDVLLAKITPCFENGKKALAENLINNIGAGSTEFIVLRVNEKILPKMLLCQISTNEFLIHGKVNMTGSVGHKRVPKDFVKNWEILLPSLEEQTEIVNRVEIIFSALDEIEEEIKQSLKEIELFIPSILQKAFSGELTEKWRKENPELISGENSAKALLEKIAAEKAATKKTKKQKK